MINAFRFTVTIFNKFKSNGITTWNKTILDNCYFSSVLKRSLSDKELSDTSIFVCRIPENSAYTTDYNGEPDKFTLTPGDIIVKGAVDDIIQDVSGKRAADILNKYKNKCFTVNEVSDNTLLANKPHYRASGV